MKEILFTVCGRGGSKGIKNKNIRPLCGVPLIDWTLFDAASAFRNDGEIRKTLAVDSDSDEILETAGRFAPGAYFHKRRNELAGDRAAKMDVIGEVLSDASRDTGRTFDAVVDLDITSPLRTPEDIERTCDVFFKGKKDVVFSVVPARRNPYFNMVERNADGRFTLCKPSSFVARQQAPEVFDMNASIYAYNPDVFGRDVKSPAALDFDVFIMRDFGIIDIDHEEDLEMMNLLLEHGEHLLPDGLREKKKTLMAQEVAGCEGRVKE
jgi:CMP-N,N'-diacetyllegionaminic acid synthase